MARLAATLKNSVATLAVCGLVLQGCESAQAPAGYMTAADDPCIAQRQNMKGAEEYFLSGAAAGAIAGGVAGALATDRKSVV